MIYFCIGYIHSLKQNQRDYEKTDLVDRKYPVLVRLDKTNFYEDEVENVLGFKSFVLYDKYEESMEGSIYMRCLDDHLHQQIYGQFRFSLGCEESTLGRHM